MSITKTLGLVGIVLSVVVTAAIGQTNPVGSVKMGNLTWTKENINIKTPDSWCHESIDANCAVYGRLYSWEAAKKVCQSMGDSWRLPTSEDWNNLVDYAGGKKVAGKKLKTTSGWNKDGNGTDDYGFSAMPGGTRGYSGGAYGRTGESSKWWSTLELDAGSAYYWNISYSDDGMSRENNGKSYGFSVRCVKD